MRELWLIRLACSSAQLLSLISQTCLATLHKPLENCRFLIDQRFFINESCKDVLKMSSDHSDLWAGIGAVVSSALSVLAWFHSIGLTALFTFVAGSLFTLWRVERLEKKRRKRDFDLKRTEYIYGPLHKELTAIGESLEQQKAFSSSDVGESIETC